MYRPFTIFRLRVKFKVLPLARPVHLATVVQWPFEDFSRYTVVYSVVFFAAP